MLYCFTVVSRLSSCPIVLLLCTTAVLFSSGKLSEAQGLRIQHTLCWALLAMNTVNCSCYNTLVFLYIHQSIHPSIHPSIYPSIYTHTHVYIIIIIYIYIQQQSKIKALNMFHLPGKCLRCQASTGCWCSLILRTALRRPCRFSARRCSKMVRGIVIVYVLRDSEVFSIILERLYNNCWLS